MSSSDNASDSSDSVEYLITSRSRRSNAGNKLKKLLEQEINDTRQKLNLIQEDDEIDLLFKEDEDDEEFEIVKSNNNSSIKLKDTDDLMFSSEDDDDEANDEDNDEEAGEKELQKMEKLKRKRKRNIPAVVKKRSVQITDTNEIKPSSHHDEIKAESLLTATRRTSKRASAVANKLKVYEKLSRAEERRKEIQAKLKKHKEEQAKFHTLTQEDRLKIAEETEKLNLNSLNQFREQEIFKKEIRMANQQKQKIKFKPNELIITMLSTSWQVSPIMELEDYKYWSEQLQKRSRKKRKKYVRKPKKQLTDEITTEVRTEENTEKPITSTDEILKTINDDKTPTTNDSKSNNENLKPNDESSELNNKNVNPNTEDLKPNDATPKSKSLLITIHPKTENAENTENDTLIKKEPTDSTPAIESEPSSIKTTEITIHNDNDEPAKLKQVSFVNEPEIKTIDKNSPVISVKNSKESTPTLDDSIDEVTPKLEGNSNVTSADELNGEALDYEGPFQLISKNFITAFKFSDFLINHTQNKFDYNFLPTNANVRDNENIEPVLRSRMKDDDNNETDLYSKGSEVNTTIKDENLIPNLKFLDGFPSIGEYDKKVADQVDEEDTKVESIKIVTKAPTGILINNIKKRCLINNQDCVYFDPKMGVPYSDLASYKIIQDLQRADSNYRWFGFENGGVYLDINKKPAKGTPEGF